MKKTLTYLLLILFLTTPRLIYARNGEGTQSYENYYVKVSNVNGATIYEIDDSDNFSKTNNIIPYDTKVKVENEEKLNNDGYFLLINWNNNKYIVESKDLENITEYTFTNYSLIESDYYVYRDTEVRNGPSLLYNIVGTIKANTNIYVSKDYHGIDNNDNEGNWMYVSDGNISGFIFNGVSENIITNSVAQKASIDEYYYVGYKDANIGLEFGNKLDVIYIIDEYKYISYYIKYNNNHYLLKDELVGRNIDSKLIFLDFDTDCNNFYYLNSTKSEIEPEKIFKYNTEYSVKYMSSEMWNTNYFIEVNNKIYIFETSDTMCQENYDMTYILSETNEKEIVLTEDMFYGFNTYESYDLMKKGTKIKAYVLYENEFYSKQYGFFYSTIDDRFQIDSAIDENTNENLDENEIKDTIVNNNENLINNSVTEDNDSTIEKNNINNKMLIIIIIFVVVIVGTFTLLLFFKKKKQKTNTIDNSIVDPK